MKPAGEIERHLYPVDAPAPAGSPQRACRPVDLQPDWQRILADMTRLGVVRLRVANPVAELEALCEPWSMRSGNGLAKVEGPGIDLLALTADLASATVENAVRDEPERHRLRWFNWRGEETLRLSLTEESAWSCFRSILVRQWAQPATPRTVPDTPEAAIAVLQRQADTMACQQIPDPRLCWYLPQLPHASMPGVDTVRPVDPTLVSPFLETLADQDCGMRVAVGSGGALQVHDTDFYAFSCRDGCLRLSGSTARLVLAHERLDSAEILSANRGGRRQHCIRLADDRQRTVAMLCPSASAHADAALWDTLIGALAD
jgi:putative heme degradation protein